MTSKPGYSSLRPRSERGGDVPRARLRRLATTLALALALLLPLALAAVALPAAVAYSSGNSGLYDNAASVPRAPVAIVLGAGLTPDGRPSPMLADRVDTAVALYRDGRVDRLLMTGDNSRVGYDEVTAMKERAVSLGVPAAQVNLDYAGFRTYDSAYRARAVFGVESAVFVTQRYHLPRALYLARSFGIEATGLAAGRDRYPRQDYYNLREFVALAASWYEVNVTRPLPRYLGDPVDLERQDG
jgi:vancomycin permeability regulator SanA